MSYEDRKAFYRWCQENITALSVIALTAAYIVAALLQ